jgi:hypothetical protein
MKVAATVNGVLQYLFEAIARIFAPRDDAYPETGVQPYTGDVSPETQSSEA